mgnify:CR=1 FL=1
METADQNTGFNPESFEILAHLEADNFWFRSRNRLILWALGRYFPSCQSMLEVGCGTGFVLSAIEKRFPSWNLFGTELYDVGLQFAAKRLTKAQLYQMDARHLQFKNEFDVIGSFDVVEHIEEDEQVLSQFHHALKKDGGLILTVPQHPFLWTKYDEYACHARRYRSTELRQKLEKAGFQITLITSFVSLLFPLMILSRLKKKSSVTESDVLNELRLPIWLNRVLEAILLFEQMLIRWGIHFPFGGSLLVVARKIEK